ncbi:MAG: RimK family alpha-L-glutamate ligase [Promethearchaeota archaeon]
MKVIFSAKKEHDVFKKVIKKLSNIKNLECIFHDPIKEFFKLEEIPQILKDIDYIIVKVASEGSIDLLHFAKLYNIPTLHDLNAVLTCMNKIALDGALRKIFKTHADSLSKFSLPLSWNQNVLNIIKFKKWAEDKLPIVIKSHNQHDKYRRFNFLVKYIEEIDQFCTRYKEFLYYDVYVQKFIECDGFERKIYVIGDKIFGIKRENPIYIHLRERPNNIEVDNIKREPYNVSKEIKVLTKILSKELNLKIFGYDLIKSIDKDLYFLIDLNDFPGFRGIDNVEDVFVEFFKTYLNL